MVSPRMWETRTYGRDPPRESVDPAGLRPGARPDAERVPVRVAQVELAHAPRLVGRRVAHLVAEAQRQRVRLVDLRRRADPPADPVAAGLVVALELRGRPTAGALGAAAEEELGVVVAVDPGEPGLLGVVRPAEADLPAE